MALADRLLKKIPQYTRNARHLRSVLQHATPKKLANLARVEYERVRRRVEVASHPYLLIIDPCNFCNLRCPLCPTGLNDLGREQSMMPFEHFKHYIDPHLPYLFEAYLHNWGESLMNKDLFRMVEYTQAHNVGTNLSSNLVIATSQHLDNMIDSGLEYVVVSLDGASADTYSKYRIRGDFDRVLDNMSELVRRRDARGKKTPVVEWQFIVMKTNEHETTRAEAMAKSIGVDLIRFIPVGMPFEFRNRKEVADEWYPESVTGRHDSDGTEQQFGQAGKPGPCFYLYRSMVVNADGGVSPCCVVYKQHRDFAQLPRDARIDVTSIWNNERYHSARSLFSAQQVDRRRPTVCDTCDIFAYHPSKGRARVPPPHSAQIHLHPRKVEPTEG